MRCMSFFFPNFTLYIGKIYAGDGVENECVMMMRVVLTGGDDMIR